MDSYGVAAYQEVNPALFAVITFPFLFSAMFGDIGHGAIIFAFALWLILDERKLAKKEEEWGEIFGLFYLCVDHLFLSLLHGLTGINSGRYIILLMGAFSMYTGFLYNDIFSLSLGLWDSGWTFGEPNENNQTTGVFTGNTYPFGLDPAWHGTQNRLIFANSFKMKLSIVLGIAHVKLSDLTPNSDSDEDHR